MVFRQKALAEPPAAPPAGAAVPPAIAKPPVVASPPSATPVPAPEAARPKYDIHPRRRRPGW
jgi:hypothetical protein